MAQMLSAEILNFPVEGVNLKYEMFREHLPTGRPVIVFFVRHFG